MVVICRKPGNLYHTSQLIIVDVFMLEIYKVVCFTPDSIMNVYFFSKLFTMQTFENGNHTWQKQISNQCKSEKHVAGKKTKI